MTTFGIAFRPKDSGIINIGLPIRLRNWFGIVSETSFEKIASSKFFQVLAGIAGLAGFLASLVTILQGWPAIKDLLNNLKLS